MVRSAGRVLCLTALFALSGGGDGTAPTAARADSPLDGRRQFLDCDGNHEGSSRQYKAWPWVWAYRGSRPAKARLLKKIAQVPTVKWFAGVTSTRRLRRVVERYLAAVDDPQRGGADCRAHLDPGERDAYVGGYPIVALRGMQHYGCKGYDGGGAWNKVSGGRYKPWVDAFVDQWTKTFVADEGYRYRYFDGSVYPYGHFERVRDRAGAVILEPDALGFMGDRSDCLTATARRYRLDLLEYAARRLGALPKVETYIDAGASDWLRPGEAVAMLRAAGVAHVRGFALNATHFQSTRQEVRFGDKVAKALGKHYVVNTAENAHGSLPRRLWRAGSRSKWCNPKNAGLGTQPTASTASKWADAYLWISRPGISSNGKVGVKACGEGPIGNVWFEKKALWEARQASFGAARWPPKPF